MSTIELKNKLKDKIEQLNEDYLLEHLISIIDIETSEEFLKLPESHKQSIDTGLAQIKDGKAISNSEVVKRVEQWSGK